jgi:uncharacterized membrane protein
VCLRCAGVGSTEGVVVEIFKHWADTDGGLYFLAKYFHVLVGITWIGLLYFFNLVQVPAFAEMGADARGEALRKVTWRALWWFRYAALATFLTGVVMLGIAGSDFKMTTGRGASIYMGAFLATTMFLNVWGVIWRNQKINIGNSVSLAEGGPGIPGAADAAKKAARASRVNTFFSIPMLFLMLFASHYSALYGDFGTLSGGKVFGAWIVLLAVWAFAEGSALGLIGGLDSPFNKAVFDDHRTTIYAGLVYLAIVLFICWELIIGS